jgi:predicted permease
MSTVRSFFARLRNVLRKNSVDRDMADQTEHHLELMTEENILLGMGPAEARQAALKKFGGVEQIKERAREESTFAWLEHLLQDVKYGVRQLARNPGFTLIAVFSIAVAIGTNTAIFSLLDEIMLKPLPVREPGRLVRLTWFPGASGGWMRHSVGVYGADDVDESTGRKTSRLFSYRTFEEFRKARPTCAEIFASATLSQPNVMVDDTTEQVRAGQLYSGDAFRILGINAVYGRLLIPEDDSPKASAVMVISYRYWQSRFGGDPDVLGKLVTVNGVEVAIVGVGPPGFVGTLSGDIAGADVFAPLALAEALRQDARTRNADYGWLQLTGRMQPAASMAQVCASLEAVFAATTKDSLPQANDPSHLRVTAGGTARTETDRRAILPFMVVMSGMVGLLLLATCANVGNLLLARGAARRREIAVRLAVGASRARIVRQLLTESLLLAVIAGILGLLFSRLGLILLGQLLSPEDRDVIDLARIDLRVLVFTAAVALGTTILLGLVPALRATRVDLTTEFQGGRGSGPRTRSRLNKVLLVMQVTVAFVLLAAASLFLRTVHNLRARDIGFERSHLLLFVVDFSPGGYKPDQLPTRHREFVERLTALPGVQSATSSLWPLLSGYGGEEAAFSIPGQPALTDKTMTMTYNQVGPKFFATLETSFLLGHDFDSSETTANAHFAIVNHTFAQKYFGSTEPIGRFINLNGERQIVGVVRDFRQSNMRDAIKATVYIPDAQAISNPGEVHFIVRTVGDPLALATAVRQALRDFDHRLPIRMMRTQEAEIDRRITSERIFSSSAGVVGLLALLLSSIGLYGLLSFFMLRRTNEIGLRLALGALPGRVLREVLQESLGWVSTGVVLGAVGSGALMRIARSFLYEVSPADPSILIGVGVVLLGVATLASWLPAQRAAKVDPATALRCE